MSIASQVPCFFASCSASSSARLACSMLSTPARIAFFIPSAPCACAVTLLPRAWATFTIARNCSSVSRSEEHTSELQSLMRISYAVFCLKKKNKQTKNKKHDSYQTNHDHDHSSYTPNNNELTESTPAISQ